METFNGSVTKRSKVADCKPVVHAFESHRCLQYNMTKYIVVETFEVRDRNPYWYSGAGRIEPEYLTTTRSSVVTFTNETELTTYLAATYRADKRIEVYEVSRQLTPVLETKTVVKFK